MINKYVIEKVFKGLLCKVLVCPAIILFTLVGCVEVVKITQICLWSQLVQFYISHGRTHRFDLRSFRC